MKKNFVTALTSGIKKIPPFLSQEIESQVVHIEKVFKIWQHQKNIKLTNWSISGKRVVAILPVFDREAGVKFENEAFCLPDNQHAYNKLEVKFMCMAPGIILFRWRAW